MSSRCFLKLFALVLLTLVKAVDWCRLPSCGTSRHIACNNSGVFASSSTCISPSQIILTDTEIQRFLDGHNTFRNKIASGLEERFLSAKRMAKMTWDPQSAIFASLNTLKCIMKHDPCRNTESLNHVGQNVASICTTGTYTTDEVIDKALNSWYNEKKSANMTDIDRRREQTSSGGVIGHFTVMVKDKATTVGCGIARFEKPKDDSTLYNCHLVTCNYATTNIYGSSVYKSGPVASECTLGADSTFPGLCKDEEPIDPNN